jgi:hypothetical protein
MCERSDETRREDSLYDSLSSAERNSRKRAEKITELERIIVAAKECVKITQERNDRLQIKLNEQKAKLNNQIHLLKEMVVRSQMAKLCWCDKCQKKRNMKEWKEKLERELDAMLVVKEVQNDRKKAKSQDDV